MTTSHPKIGIRPIIDGRRGGIRESLEAMTMGMAQRVARLYSEELRYSDGSPVECVIADTTIGGVAEAAACTDKFRDSNVGAVLSVTPCWCYGAETIDMDPLIPKAIWGFNGTERPGAVYLASALAGHNQKGLPAFGIYGRDVQDMGDDTIPADVREKLLRFGRAAVAVMQMRGKSYLSIGSVSMGIAGSMPDPDFFQEYLGMRNEAVDCSEIERRIELGIYDKEEFARAMEWVEKYCKPNEGSDCNPAHLVYSREQKDAVWEYVVKMTLIFRDLMHGNPKLAEMGFEEEAMGHNAIAGGFQGQRQWTDFRPDGDFPEAILNSSFDWNGIREAVTFATENDTLNGASMLLLHLLTNRAQLFADVRTFWSPEAVERVTGRRLTGRAAGGIIHLINSLANQINSDPLCRGRLQVVFLENYRVSLAEHLMPASEVSQQISTAGKEASGTGNMKFMMNGALTVGTLDGANVEMHEVLGDENMFLFGLHADEVARLKAQGYAPQRLCERDDALKRVVDQLRTGFSDGVSYDDLAQRLLQRDEYMLLQDFASYCAAEQRMAKTYADRAAWDRMSLLNIARSGIFAADRAVAQYADNIWHVPHK